MTMQVACACGLGINVYVPKSLPLQWQNPDTAEGGLFAEDDSEEDIKAIRHISGLMGTPFVDLRDTTEFQCPECGTVLDIEAMLRGRERSVKRRDN